MSTMLPEHITWETWGRLFTDVDRWRAAVTAVWAANPSLPGGRGPSPDQLVAGYPGTCAVFIVDDAAVVKFFPPFAHQDYQRERYCLRHLTAVPYRPRLLADGVLHDRLDWPYLVTSFERGLAWRDQRSVLTPGEKHSIAAELGRTLRTLHRQPVGSGPAWPAPDSWAALAAARLAAAPRELAELTALPSRVLAQAADLLEHTDWALDAGVIVHADVTEDHVLVEQQVEGWRLSSLIDWADAEVAAASYEWVALWFGVCDREPGLLQTLLAAYDPTLVLDSGFTERLLAFTLLHRFGPQIIAHVLTAEEQRTCRSLEALADRLYPGLP